MKRLHSYTLNPGPITRKSLTVRSVDARGDSYTRVYPDTLEGDRDAERERRRLLRHMTGAEVPFIRHWYASPVRVVYVSTLDAMPDLPEWLRNRRG
jgi:hypothetical protein